MTAGSTTTIDLNRLLAMMVERKAYILHLIGGTTPMISSYHGGLTPLLNEPIPVNEVTEIIKNALTPVQKDQLLKVKEISMTISVEGLSRFRGSIFYQRGTLAGVFKRIPPEPIPIDMLGLPSLVKEFPKKRGGLFLIAGPRSSGKSASLASIVNYFLTTTPSHIVSVENPIEFLLKNQQGVIYQREVGVDTLSFNQAVITAAKQGPDLLVLSDLPNIETISTVLHLAATGQMVLASFSANGAILALEQIVEIFPPHQQIQIRTHLSFALDTVLGHTLVEKNDKSLSLVVEILFGNSAVKQAVKEGRFASLLQIMQNSRDEGMMPQEFVLKGLVKKGEITKEEAMAKAVRPEEMRRLLAASY